MDKVKTRTPNQPVKTIKETTMQFIQKSIKNESQPQNAQAESKADIEENPSKLVDNSKREENQDLSTQRLGSQNRQLKIETRNEVNYSP